MPRAATRRIVSGLLTLWVVSVLVFGATLALPGDAAVAILGRDATPARLAEVRQKLHLNESAVSQYAHWLGGVVTLNPGRLGRVTDTGRRWCSAPGSRTACG